MKAFNTPRSSIGPLDADAAATLIATAADLAIIVDGEGIIQDVAFQRADLSMELEGSGKWFGRHWSEIVSPASQPKVETLLKEAGTHAASRWRQLTHQTTSGQDIPLLYAAVRLEGDRLVALGRDLRAVAALQQRLVDAQMSMERDFAKLRFAETRYRVLFQTSPEPVLVLDATTFKIQEANPAATLLLEAAANRGPQRGFGDLFDPASRAKAQGALVELKSNGRTDDLETMLVDGRPVIMTCSLFRQETASLVLVRLAPTAPFHLPKRDTTTFNDFAERAPDGFVLADADGRILAANHAFAAMVQAGSEEETRGRLLDQWFGRSGIDFDVMMANLRQHGSVRLFSTVLQSGGAVVNVEASAVALGGGKRGTFGFAIRDVGQRVSASASRSGQELPRSANQLSELIGRVPLKELVRETTEVIERLCIEKALELTGDNRASAAELLGLSRQSLYVKLRRFGFADALGEDESQT